MDKLLIVDGHNLLFQMFYGMPSRIVNRDGKAIHGVLGFVGALLKIIRIIEPTHAVVLFDSEQKNKRSDLDPRYKANRTDYSQVSEQDNPFSQLSYVYDALDYMKIPHTEVKGCETDDMIASYAFNYTETKIIISSFDSDFFQLINENVSVLRYRGKISVICDSDYVYKKYGILPSQYVDFKSLTGDKADNISGARGIGIKNAATLITQFGTLENIIANAEEIAKPSIRKSVLDNTERLRLNQRLIRLNGGEKLPFDIDELKYRAVESKTSAIISGIGL